MRSPELHPLLQGGTPSPATRQSALIRRLADEANFIGELIERLKVIEPQLREDCIEGTDAHLRHISNGRYREAYGLILNYGVPKR
jgi:hypothetical protein